MLEFVTTIRIAMQLPAWGFPPEHLFRQGPDSEISPVRWVLRQLRPVSYRFVRGDFGVGLVDSEFPCWQAIQWTQRDDYGRFYQNDWIKKPSNYNLYFIVTRASFEFIFCFPDSLHPRWWEKGNEMQRHDAFEFVAILPIFFWLKYISSFADSNQQRHRSWEEITNLEGQWMTNIHFDVEQRSHSLWFYLSFWFPIQFLQMDTPVASLQEWTPNTFVSASLPTRFNRRHITHSHSTAADCPRVCLADLPTTSKNSTAVLPLKDWRRRSICAAQQRSNTPNR